MRTVTFNIRCCNDKNGHSVSERAPRLKSVIDKYDPDIVGFQEVTPRWEPFIPSDYEDKYEVYNIYRDPIVKEGCTLLWKKDKYELFDKGCFWFSKTPWVTSLGGDLLYKCRRFCIYAVLTEKESGKRFAVFNTHFGFGDEYQIESLELIKQTAETVGEKNTFIIGDFNLKPDSLPYKRATELFTDANTLLENDMTTTYHNYGTVDDWHIDYLFINGDGVKPISYKLMDETYEGKYPSDHYGLCFDLEIE